MGLGACEGGVVKKQTRGERFLPEKGEKIFHAAGEQLREQGLLLGEGAVVDAPVIQAPPPRVPRGLGWGLGGSLPTGSPWVARLMGLPHRQP